MHRLAVLIMALDLVGLTGCHSTQWSDLRHFVEADGFEAAPGSVYPRPATVPGHLYSCVKDAYDINKSVRRELAYYFLKYDAALTQQGLISVNCGQNDLISILWTQEAKRNPMFKENPGTTVMRQWISTESRWFDLREREERQLSVNWTEFDVLRQSWSQ